MATRPAELRDVHQGPNGPRSSLFAPLRYLQIEHADKAWYDTLLPGLTSAISWGIYHWLIPSMSIFGESGLLRFERDFLIMAVPFLFGALATVAMAAPSPTLDRRPPGAELILAGRPLNLRQFVCYLLGYLAFLGILTLVGAVAAQLVHDPAKLLLTAHPSAKVIVFGLGTFVIFALANYILVTTLWALYFLTDVVNR